MVYTQTPKHRKRISKALKGRTFTDEHKRNLRKATYRHYRGKGWINDLEKERVEKIERISVKGKNGHIGLKLSEIARKNISKGMKQYFIDGGTISSRAGRGKGGYREDLGHFVRSTWEANISRIWQAQGYIINKDYFYEPKCFVISRTTYTPDFYFVLDNIYYEIKAYDTEEAKKKRIMTRKKYGIKIVVIRKYTYLRLKDENSSMINDWEY